MPEGPQIRALAARLRSGLIGRRLVLLETASASAEITDANSSLGQPHVFDFVTNRGKLLVLRAAHGEHSICLMIHLRLSGRIDFETPAFPRPRALLRIVTDGIGVAGAQPPTWDIVDPRGIATWAITDAAGARATLDAMGPDAASISLDAFAGRLGGSTLQCGATREHPRCSLGSGAIGNVLVDQAVVAGIGNCIRSEILWRARIAPGRAANALTSAEVARLHAALGSVYTEQYAAANAASAADPLHVPKELLRVYKRKVDANGKTVVKQKMGSMMVYWVPSRQV